MSIPKDIQLLLPVLLFVACQGQDVHTYRIAKENPQTAGDAPILAEAPAMPSAQPTTTVHWKTPSEWRALPASGMRLASFVFEGRAGSKVDISIIALPGMAGGDLANVNRWRGQLGLEPLDDAGLVKQSQNVKSRAGEVLVVDFTGMDPKGEVPGKARMLGAILSLGDKQWFFKAMGQESAVGQVKPSFLRFLRSLRRASNS